MLQTPYLDHTHNSFSVNSSQMPHEQAVLATLYAVAVNDVMINIEIKLGRSEQGC
jgi:hypothetical protein